MLRGEGKEMWFRPHQKNHTADRHWTAPSRQQSCANSNRLGTASLHMCTVGLPEAPKGSSSQRFESCWHWPWSKNRPLAAVGQGGAAASSSCSSWEWEEGGLCSGGSQVNPLPRPCSAPVRWAAMCGVGGFSPLLWPPQCLQNSVTISKGDWIDQGRKSATGYEP